MIYLNAIGKNKDFQKNCQIVPNYKKIHKQPYFLEIFVAKKKNGIISAVLCLFFVVVTFDIFTIERYKSTFPFITVN